MPQEFQAQELTSTNTSFSTGYSSGTVCPRTGSYKAENRYMQAIVVVIRGAKFPNFIDGKKCTWTALSSTTTTNSFESTKVAAGTV